LDFEDPLWVVSTTPKGEETSRTHMYYHPKLHDNRLHCRWDICNRRKKNLRTKYPTKRIL